MVAPEPIFEPRGTPFSVVGRLKALSDMGYRVDLVTYGIGENINLPGLRFLRIPSIPGVRKIKIGPSYKKIVLDFFLMLMTLRQMMRGSFDLIHTHEEAGLWGIIFSRWFDVPHIYDMHSSLPQQLNNFEFTKSRLIKNLFISLEKWILKYASAIITICPDLENQVASLYPERGSVLIENVIDYGTVFGETDHSTEIIHTLGLTGKRIVLYTGTLEPYQGMDLLIESAIHVLRKMPGTIFLAVGGQTDQVNHYRLKAESAGVSGRFIFTGQIQPELVNSYIHCADVLVSPRISGTNTPLKIYTYLRSGVPIVATRVLTHTQVLDDRVAMLTLPDPGAFAQGILEVITHKQYREKLVKQARILADTKYSYSMYKQKFARVIHLALERGT